MKHITLLLLSALSVTLSALAQGPLAPPGAPAPTFKTLQQVEPRTPIANLPYFITQPGSYYVVTNLITGGSGGIVISNNNVTVDLNGFALIGAGGGNGVRVGGSRTNIAIRNGTLSGWNGAVDATSASSVQLERISASHNVGTSALAAGDHALVVACTADFNSNVGILAGLGSVVKMCAASGNGGFGIQTFSGGTVSGCSVISNTTDGIRLGFNSTVIDCTASFNGNNGISLSQGSLARNNTCVGNGGAGIVTTGFGNTVDQNHVANNSRGIEVPIASNLIIRNSASRNPPTGATSSSNYVFTGTPNFGPTNATTGVVTNHPWANFNF